MTNKIFLLDTHTFLWWNTDPTRLSPAVQAVLMDATNRLLLSLVSLWEMQIKISIGKMRVPPSLPEVVKQNREVNGLELLPLAEAHIYALENLPLLHRDPFDRLLIAQAMMEGAVLLTKDATVSAYPVTTLW